MLKPSIRKFKIFQLYKLLHCKINNKCCEGTNEATISGEGIYLITNKFSNTNLGKHSIKSNIRRPM